MSNPLQELHDNMAEELLKKLSSGEMSAAEMRVALDLLKHNGITAKVDANKGLAGLMDALPAFDVVDGGMAD